MTIGSDSVTLLTLQTHTSDPALPSTHTQNTDQSWSDRATTAACAGWNSAGIGDFTALPLGPLSMHQTPVKTSALWGKTHVSNWLLRSSICTILAIITDTSERNCVSERSLQLIWYFQSQFRHKMEHTSASFTRNAINLLWKSDILHLSVPLSFTSCEGNWFWTSVC